MTKIWTAPLLAVLAVSAGGVASAKTFKFAGVEYMSSDQRLPAAQAFVARVASPGTRLRHAVAAVERAGAACRPAADQGGVVTCKYDALRKRPGETESDIVWTVQITPTRQGAVGSATVQRDKAGGI